MSHQYQALLNLTVYDADIINANNLILKKDASIGGNLNVAGTTSLAELILPAGAATDFVLKSDAEGKASWAENTVAGDITGNTAATVQHHKWIGNWDAETQYNIYNRVTHDHVEYRALFDNVGTSPSTEIGSYSLYNEAYPAPAHSTLVPDSLHAEIALRFEPNQRGFLTHFKFYNVSLETVDIKIYASPGWAVVHEQTSAVGLGWQTIELTSPVPVLPRQSILAAMVTNGQPYAYIPQDFDVLLDMDPAVYVGNDATSTETVFWYAKPGHPSSLGNPPMNGGYFNRVYLIDVIYEVGRTWEVVLSDRPDTVYEEKSQPLRNKTDVDVVDLLVHNQITYPAGAVVGKVLTCTDGSGACSWADPVQTNAVTMLGDVTGPSNASVVNTLAGGTIQVADLVLEEAAQPLRNKTDVDVVDLTVHNSMKLKVSTIPSGTYALRYMVGFMNPDFNDCAWVNDLYAPIISAQSQLLYSVNAGAGKILSCVDGTGLAQWIAPPSQTMSGDVTGTTSASVVNTLAGGTIPVNQLVTLNGIQTVSNKTFPASSVKFRSDTDATKLLRFDVGSSSANTELTLRGISTANRVVVFPDASDTLVGKNTVDALTNKTLNDATNTVYANGVRTATWTVPVGGSAPVLGNVLYYNGSNAVWVNAASLITLAGDVTGPINNTVAVKATTDFAVGRILTLSNLDRIKKIVLWDGGVATDPTDHRFFGLGITSSQQRYQVPSGGAHVFYAATSATTSTELARINGAGDLSVTGYLTPAKTVRLSGKNKAITFYDNGDINNDADWRFSGIGSSGASMIYNLGYYVSSHIFRVADSATTYRDLIAFVGTGYTRTDYPIYMGDAMEIKKLALFDESPGSKGFHNFSGFGTSNVAGNKQLRYHLTFSDWSHVFYAAGSGDYSVELARITGGGDLSVARTISASNGDRRKKIVVHEEGTATDSGDHRFHGLGVQPYQMRYQVSSTANSHRFYAATSATTSNELFMISGDGNSVANGVMFSRVSSVDTWRTPTLQGAWMGWNRGGQYYNGQTVFANQQGLGTGGWEWVNFNNSNVQEPSGAASMILDKWGNLSIRGNLNVAGNMGGDETNTQGYWRSSNGTQSATHIRFIKTGKLINLSVTAWSTNTPSSGYVRWTNLNGGDLTIPSWALPSLASALDNYHHPITLTDKNYNRVSGTIEITYQGKLMISPNAGINLDTRCGWNPFSITYPATNLFGSVLRTPASRVTLARSALYFCLRNFFFFSALVFVCDFFSFFSRSS